MVSYKFRLITQFFDLNIVQCSNGLRFIFQGALQLNELR
jgi:hypothetical protein